jgi:cytochrome c2
VIKLATVKVHFNDSGNKGEDIFSKKSGSCHRVVTGHLGALGSSDIGPNLSGLFFPYYPKRLKNGENWTPHNLGDWLKNPSDKQLWLRMRLFC